jgi:restriction system protein
VAENNPINVIAAFEILLEEIEAEIEAVSEAGAKAFGNRDFSEAQEALKNAERITDFRGRIAGLRQEWIGLAHNGRAPAPPPGRATEAYAEQRLRHRPGGKRRSYGHLRPGLKTPEEEYRIPILQALAERNGSARVREVLGQVYEKIKHRLNDVDREQLPSNSKTTRWENTAQWARHRMVQEGLLKSNSPHGVWEITEKGRRILDRVVTT